MEREMISRDSGQDDMMTIVMAMAMGDDDW